MQVNNIGNSNGSFNLFQNRDIAHTGSRKMEKDFNNKNLNSQSLTRDINEVVPKSLIERITTRHGENFFDNISKNSNNEITFGNLKEHMKENSITHPRNLRAGASVDDLNSVKPKKMRETFENEKVMESDIEIVKQRHGDNALDGFKPIDSENITFKELRGFIKTNMQDDKHVSSRRNAFLNNNQASLNNQDKNMIDNELQNKDSNNIKRSNFMFSNAYSRDDMSKIFMDVAI